MSSLEDTSPPAEPPSTTSPTPQPTDPPSNNDDNQPSDMTVVEPETTVSDPMKCTRLGVKILDVVKLGGTEGSKGAGSELRATVFVGGENNELSRQDSHKAKPIHHQP